MQRRPLLLLALFLVAGACATDDGRLLPLDETELTDREAYFAAIEAEGSAFEALRAGGDDGPEAIRRFVETAYDPEIVLHDATFGDHREGWDEVADMYRLFLFYFGEAIVDARPALVGSPTALQVIPFWDMSLGRHRFTESEPLIEVDLVEVSGDRIASLRLFYDVASLQRIHPDAAPDGSVQARYAAAWSSGDLDEVSALYSDAATRVDGLAGLEATGRGAIRAEATRWFDALPGASWTVRLAFAELKGDQGAVFEVSHDGCGVEVGILFEVIDGLIRSESIHYDPAAVRACGWAE